MPNKIVMGFQNTVDFELAWDLPRLNALTEAFEVRSCELDQPLEIKTERDLLIVLLQHMRAGTGTECIVNSSRITRQFASRFSYQVTLGGTAVRAAIALSMLGVPSTIHACSDNHHFRRLLPDSVKYLASVPDEGEDFNPHVILQFPAGAHIQAGDVDFVTHRPNRVIFAYDPPSVNLVISEEFGTLAASARVFLAASYNAMKDPVLLRQRLDTSLGIFRQLPPGAITIMEDACFSSSEIRRDVTQTLAPHLQIFSMNEDELQDRLGRRIDILDPKAVAEALETVAAQIRVPVLICHSAYWALAYGEKPQRAEAALRGGVAMASTRFRMGDFFTMADFLRTQTLADDARGTAFAQAIARELDGRICCIPGKDLRFVAKPTTIGLGDAFAGGMLFRLSEKERF